MYQGLKNTVLYTIMVLLFLGNSGTISGVQGQTLTFILDCSASMDPYGHLAHLVRSGLISHDDLIKAVGSENRMAASNKALAYFFRLVQVLKQQFPQDLDRLLVQLIIFGSNAKVQLAPEFLQQLDTTTLASKIRLAADMGGTNYVEAFKAAVQCLNPHPENITFFLTDGEDGSESKDFVPDREKLGKINFLVFSGSFDTATAAIRRWKEKLPDAGWYDINNERDIFEQYSRVLFSFVKGISRDYLIRSLQAPYPIQWKTYTKNALIFQVDKQTAGTHILDSAGIHNFNGSAQDTGLILCVEKSKLKLVPEFKDRLIEELPVYYQLWPMIEKGDTIAISELRLAPIRIEIYKDSTIVTERRYRLGQTDSIILPEGNYQMRIYWAYEGFKRDWETQRVSFRVEDKEVLLPWYRRTVTWRITGVLIVLSGILLLLYLVYLRRKAREKEAAWNYLFEKNSFSLEDFFERFPKPFQELITTYPKEKELSLPKELPEIEKDRITFRDLILTRFKEAPIEKLKNAVSTEELIKIKKCTEAERRREWHFPITEKSSIEIVNLKSDTVFEPPRLIRVRRSNAKNYFSLSIDPQSKSVQLKPDEVKVFTESKKEVEANAILRGDSKYLVAFTHTNILFCFSFTWVSNVVIKIEITDYDKNTSA